MDETEYIQFTGVVKRVSESKDNHAFFTAETITSKNIYTCTCPFFCPLRVGDIINALCIMEDENKLQLISPPFVEIPSTKDNIIKIFLIILKKLSYAQGYRIYSDIEKKVSQSSS